MKRLLSVHILAVAASVSVFAADGDTLSLATAQRIALEDNPSLMAVTSRIDQARARVRQAVSAYLPRVDATVSANKTWLPDDTSSSFSQLSIPTDMLAGLDLEIDDTQKNYRAGVTATWTLFDGFARWFRNSQARFGARETEIAYREAQRMLLDAVARAYYSAQLAHEQISIAEADEAFNMRLLDEAKARRRAGAGSLSDELNFEVRANVARTTLIRSRRNYETAMIGLAALMGKPESEFGRNVQPTSLAAESPSDLDMPVTTELIEYAYANRPDIEQGRWAVKRAEAGVGAERGAFLPRVDASASYQADSDNSVFDDDEFSTILGISLSYNLFAGGHDTARYAEARSALREAKRQLSATEIQAASEVRETVEAVKSAQDELRLQKRNADFVKRNRDLVEKEYAAGQGSLVRLNEAQRDLSQARAFLAQARVSLRQAWHSLKTATSETLDTRTRK